ncbi:glycosyltransferase family 4 protein [Mangrovimonas cancribranchiae]|uniref:Glycosyltransferase family 4 protein n=1 Tax=Mangrovimonas cancribranchiae TaxID=3080055 RepID=A0AAU6P0D9_9FLAO
MKRKTIVFIVPSLKAGGAERVVSTLANQLVVTYNVIIVVLYRCIPFYFLNERIKVVFCQDIYNESPTFFESINNHYYLIKSCKNVIKNYQADVIIGFTTIANIYSIILSKILKIPAIISERIHPKYGSISKFWKIVRRLTYPTVNALVIQTNDIKSYFKKYINPSKLFIINNPISVELSGLRDLNATREDRIICVGRLEAQKNQELLIRAFSKIPSNSWELILIGDGKLKTKYINLAKSLNVSNIVFLGSIKNISHYYNTSKIFVLPSNYEGFPNALIEAMYFGVACIATDCPSGPSDIIINNKNGFLIPTNDQNALKNKLEKLINTPNLQEQFGEESLKSSTLFETKPIVQKWEKLIDFVCS